MSTARTPLGVIEIDIPSRTDLVTVVRMIVASAASAGDALGGDRLDDLRWVCSEATTNAVQANLNQDPPGRVRARCEIGKDWVRLIVIDEGPGMSNVPEVPDMEHPDRLLVEGGFGIPLMQQLSSGEVSYETSAEGTTVELEVRQ